ncbi:hypothetical protein Cme02nite_64660 [Catellatospora methionotrophica]|uniref:DUF2188 domain-containing protein n=1 Tax=Catellatospora methionotrophica TaxID=121620 RepID=A0A8J3LG02_9ACTN|nr:DUF2188 domain-containing protein [Catellatospora methionotrophica]GIG18134.1 hypothetical protein Cme02nite_64660 [Catellatospora methionotrophica]
MERTVYRVEAAGEQWELREGDKVVASDARKEDLVHRARQTARDNKPSQLMIHDSQGRIEDESTYQDDPFPPAG